MADMRQAGGAPTRRAVLGAGAAVAGMAGPAMAAQPSSPPIIDTHIHLFDPNRPQGVPYRGPRGSSSNTLGAFPERYAQLARPHGVVGAIKVEASPWLEDNLWVLEVSARHEIMVGVIGALKPEHPEFPDYLNRFAKHPLFRGIRYGNLWGYDLVGQSTNPEFIKGLKLLAQADLTLDTANPTVELLQAVVRVSDAVPDLRIVVDHLPKLEPAQEERAAYEAVLLELQKRPKVYAKLSAVIHEVDGRVSTRLADHKARLDHLSEIFGEDRILFGSDWPNSDGASPVDDVFAIMKAYFAGKAQLQAEKYFWRNSIAAYGWRPRTPAQTALVQRQEVG